MPLERIPQYLHVSCLMHSESIRDYLTVLLAVDKKVTMSEVDKVLLKVMNGDYHHLAFAVNTSDYFTKNPSYVMRVYYPFYYFNNVIESLPYPDVPSENERLRDTIEIINDHHWKLNGTKITESTLQEFLLDERELQNIICIEYKGEVTLNSFIQTYDQLYSSLDSNRNKYSTKQFGVPLDSLGRYSVEYRMVESNVSLNLINLPIKRLSEQSLSTKQKH